ncbi:taste receptor type 2 member 7-like [Haemorhous mexicanus]|uniref:taste receptor type 2 member 7-like n=1 Tax=Haemorhous mexicanus TaxID=30427 RepID=UPI0028BE6CEC|nr:taste receptor type 2 member 7-like [Haemorhous mexicanus]XP_059699000.1 taste receptor type 2 member 7-like [Haemorhous mexicanus]XP_059699017.1 taste receptor type 2 member 7-like [Haemorhous mexicanus]
MEACHSPQQFNVTSYGALTVAFITLEAFPGMWINAFLVCVLCTDWVKKKTLNSNEKILLLLGCSRFCYLCFSWVYKFLSFIYPNYLYVPTILQLAVFFQAFFNHCNLWFSASLCGFYCIKIANFSNKSFIYLKVKIDSIVPWLLLGSGILALAVGIVAYDIADKPHCNSNSTGRGNFGTANIKMDKHFFPSFFLAGFEYAASFMVVIFAAVFLLFSLWRHKRTMQTNSMKDLSMDAHIRAMKSIFSFLVMYSINFVCLVLNMVYVTKKGNHMTFLIEVFQYIFPGLHSLILIFSNPKLEKALLKILPLQRSVMRKVCMS